MDRDFDAADAESADSENIPFLPLLGTPGYFVEKWVHLLSAYPKTGKTEITLMSVEEWLKQGKAVLWFTEEGKPVWDHRMHQRKEGLGRSFPRGCRVHVGLGQKPDELLAEMQYAPESIVIVDTLRNLLLPKDENDNSEMARVLTPWIDMHRQRENTLIFLHHARKGGGAYGEAAAGAGAITGLMDVTMEIMPKGSRTRGVIKVRARLTSPPDLIFTYDPETTNITPEAPAAASKGPRTRLEQQVLDQMPAGALYKTYDVERLLQPTPSRDAITRALFSLASAGLLERQPGLDQQVAGMTVKWLKR